MPGAELERRPVPPLPAVQRREPESLPAKAALGAWRNPHLSVPLSLPPALWTAAEVAHVIGPYAYGPVASAAVVGTAAMWWHAPRRWEDPEGAQWWQSQVWWARASCAAGCGWLALASALGPAGSGAEPLAGLLLAGGTAWGIRHFRRTRPPGRRRLRGRKAKAEARELAMWDEFWQLHCGAWGVPASRVVKVTHDGVQVILRIRLVAGRQLSRTLQQNERLIESALEGLVDVGMVRVASVAGNPHLADVYVKSADPLANWIEWDEELIPSSVHDPWPQGMSEAGQWRMVPQRLSSFIIGMSRSGKSNQQLVRIACLSRCPDARTVVIELKGRAARHMLRACAAEYVITSVAEARDYLTMLLAEIGLRAVHADPDGGEQLMATEDIPAIMTLIDEVNDLASLTNGDATCRGLLAGIAAKGMGVECYTDVAGQLGTLEESVGTDQTRSNLPMRVSFATAEARHGQYALGEKAMLDTSLLEPQGAFLVKLGPEAPQEKNRAIAMPLKQFGEVAESRLEDPPLSLFCAGEPCPVPGYRTWGEWWVRRWGRLQKAYQGDSPQYQRWLESQPEQEPQETAEEYGTQAAQPEPAPAPAVAAGPPPPGAPEHVRKAAFAAAAGMAAGEVVTPAGLAAASGMGRTWVQQRLRYMVTAGAASQRDRGEYAVTPGIDVTAVLAAEKAGDDAALAAILGDGDPEPFRLHAV